MSKIEKLTIAVLLLFGVAFLGCAGIQNAISPAYIPPETIEYSGAEVPRWPSLYTSINDAEHVMKRMQYIRSLNDVEYKFLTDDLDKHLANARELRDNIFDPDGPIGLLLPMMTGLGIGWLGLSKPSDKKKLNGNKENT